MKSRNYIYLDWNVIQYLKHGRVADGKFDAVKFKLFMQELKGKYLFPASEGHLRDLSASFKMENWPRIEEDLSFLAEISEGFMLAICPDEKIIAVKADVNAEFKKIINESKAQPNYTITGDSYRVDMNKLSRESLFRPFLEKNNGVLDAVVMGNALEMVFDSMDDSDFYKRFRSEVESVRAVFGNQESIINIESIYFKNLEAIFKIWEISDAEDLMRNFNRILSSFLSINGRVLEDMKRGEKIEVAYSLLDYSPLFRDRVNKKNRPSNMHRDVKNLFFASDGKYYVTEDDATYKKSRFITRLLNLPVRVVKMDELRLRLTCM